jgi:hypothetical protein
MLACDTALYVGDDDTDEAAFASAPPGQLLGIVREARERRVKGTASRRSAISIACSGGLSSKYTTANTHRNQSHWSAISLPHRVEGLSRQAGAGSRRRVSAPGEFDIDGRCVVSLEDADEQCVRGFSAPQSWGMSPAVMPEHNT